jgi:paraquat-inducible protein A
MHLPPRAQQLGMIGCHGCGLVCELAYGSAYKASSITHVDNPGATCPRCETRLHRRKPASLERTLAFLLAGMIFYIPANLLPVMYTSTFGSGSESTIMSGVMEFWRSGSWDIALIIFIASVAVPCTKFVVLGLLLVTVRWRNHWARPERSQLFRLVELIGYWSMLDVLVVALVAGLVQFKALSNIEPRVGILYFGIVVIFTMLSAMSFDPRLIWDDENDHERNQ